MEKDHKDIRITLPKHVVERLEELARTDRRNLKNFIEGVVLRYAGQKE